LYYLPDVTVLCGAPVLDLPDALQNPTLIMEVLLPSTETDDRTTKFRHYQQIESLRYYLLIEQYRPSVTLYGKTSEGLWAIVGDYTRLSDTLAVTLDDKTVSVPLTEIYARASQSPDFPPTADEILDSLTTGNGNAEQIVG
jgi:Uma2 family endonuclease